MESIFENGYLKSEFINQSYRGLVGWPCECDERSDITLISIEGGKTFEKWGFSGVHKCSLGEDLRIKQFTPEDIPSGELCWARITPDDIPFHSAWKLVAVNSFHAICADNGQFSKWVIVDSEGVQYDEFAPYLIAETPEIAEELKDWASC